ncbi:MAG: YlbF family regulator [Clostridiales bacterium]|nr:YlbF family regulator [Candidatus Crickella caballi]
MNVYDEAHSLAKAIKESQEFINFDRLRQEVDKDEQISSMLKDLQSMQIEIQTAQMSGKEVDPSVMSKITSLSTMIATKPLAASYIQAEGALSVMMNDVFGIIGEAIGMTK